MQARLLIALLLLLPAVALADTWLVASLGSYHVDRGDHCEVNPGIGFERGGALRLVGGVYRNSDCRTSWYGGASYAPLERGAWRAGAVLILVTGYEEHPLVAPGALVAYEGWRWGLNFVFFPGKDGRADHGVVGLQVKVRW